MYLSVGEYHMPETKLHTEQEPFSEHSEQEKEYSPETLEQEETRTEEGAESTEEDAPELEEVRDYIQERREHPEEEGAPTTPPEQSGERGAYAWLADIPPEERVDKAFNIVLHKEKRMVEVVDAFLVLKDYDNLDAFETMLRERHEELAQAGLVSSVREY